MRGSLLLLVALSGCAASRTERLTTRVTLAHVKAQGPNHLHMLRLAALAPRFAAAEGARVELVQAAALLHDATKEDGAGTPFERFCTHHQAGAELARASLPGVGYSPAETELVASAVFEHMGPCGGERFMTRFCKRDYPAPSTVEAKVLFDLDMLDLMTVNGVAKVVELRQKGSEFGRESLKASALEGPDSAWRSVREAREVLLTPSGQACGAQLEAHTKAFLDGADFGTDVGGFKQQVAAYVHAHPLPLCLR